MSPKSLWYRLLGIGLNFERAYILGGLYLGGAYILVGLIFEGAYIRVYLQFVTNLRGLGNGRLKIQSQFVTILRGLIFQGGLYLRGSLYSRVGLYSKVYLQFVTILRMLGSGRLKIQPNHSWFEGGFGEVESQKSTV